MAVAVTPDAALGGGNGGSVLLDRFHERNRCRYIYIYVWEE